MTDKKPTNSKKQQELLIFFGLVIIIFINITNFMIIRYLWLILELGNLSSTIGHNLDYSIIIYPLVSQYILILLSIVFVFNMLCKIKRYKRERLINGLIDSFIFFSVFGILVGLIIGNLVGSIYYLIFGAVFGLVIGLIICFIGGLVGILIGCVFAVELKKNVKEKKRIYN